ncbi:TIGR02646 family protein [Pseudomonas viridiflava]|uniref:retron system putative HNH endonuclease n=1 Tax=Pseudomonas viridiflava TaxID=33069 RepID=UPI001F60CE86|nr:retron system putative HNH endonuclease [Pseudomonas viridiflava]MCI3908642.1 TIGR02646 family protein [Pseudomonas viridiflava]
MRRIKKRNSYGHHLANAHSSPPCTAKQATSRWSSFGYKNQVLKFLLDEQYSLCCYSEVRADELLLDYHIEHVENKRINPSRTFDSANLAASAISDSNITALLSSASSNGTQTIFGGHAPGKQKEFDIARFISPHQEDCPRFFRYVSDGRVVPSHELNIQDAERATYTIDLLNLNSPFLIVQRRKWWDELDNLIEQHKDEFSEISDLVSIHLVPCSNRLYPFFSLTRSFFGKISEEVIAQSAPKLA